MKDLAFMLQVKKKVIVSKVGFILEACLFHIFSVFSDKNYFDAVLSEEENNISEHMR